MHSKMKIISSITLLILTTAMLVSAQKISLFDSEGEAVAYIDFDEDATIFMWNGTAVAFIKKDGKANCVFGFNGSFLGWYEDGILYDKNGYKVGARKGVVTMFYRSERIKGSQEITPVKPMTPVTPIQPVWKNSWSTTSLSEFLYFGKN
jgi:hypothetical protein